MTILCQPPTTCDNATLQSHFEDSYHEGEAESATHAAECANPMNEDAVRISLRIDGELIDAAWFKATGCDVCQAAASVLCEVVEGKSTGEAMNLSTQDFLEVIGTPLPIDRHKCALLAWRVFQRALKAAVDHEEDDDSEAIHFGGPSLSEES